MQLSTQWKHSLESLPGDNQTWYTVNARTYFWRVTFKQKIFEHCFPPHGKDTNSRHYADQPVSAVCRNNSAYC